MTLTNEQKSSLENENNHTTTTTTATGTGTATATTDDDDDDDDDDVDSYFSSSVFRPGLFLGQVALVTGGGTGIGRAIATELAILGATVIIASRNQETCRDTATQINNDMMKMMMKRRMMKEKKKNNNNTNESSSSSSSSSSLFGKVVAGPSTSIRDEEQVIQLMEYIYHEFHRLDMLINNAGGQFVSPAEDLSSRGFQAVVDTNLKGTFIVCQQAYKYFFSSSSNMSLSSSSSSQQQQQQKQESTTNPTTTTTGRIVNITLGNRNGMPWMVHSGSARAGIENMTATLCTEWMESGLRINCVRPGIIFTESGFANYGTMGDAFAQQILPSIPAKRFGSPQEISSAVLWLLSPGSSYVTGTVLCVDGGSSYTFLPLVDISNDHGHHLPVYGTLPRMAKL